MPQPSDLQRLRHILDAMDWIAEELPPPAGRISGMIEDLQDLDGEVVS